MNHREARDNANEGEALYFKEGGRYTIEVKSFPGTYAIAVTAGREYANERNARLFVDAYNTYQKDPTLPSELLRQRDAAVMHLRNMFDGFDFESGLGKPEAADAENAWNFLNTLKPTDHE